MKKRLSIDLLLPLIAEEDGNLAAIGRRCDVTRQAVSEYVHRYPVLEAAVQDARESINDEAEAALRKAIREGNITAIIFHLKTQGRGRGYVERQDVGISKAEELDFDWERAIGRLAPRPVADTESSGNGQGT